MALSVAVHSTLTTLASVATPSLYLLDGGLSDSSRKKLQQAIRRARRDVAPTVLEMPHERLRRAGTDSRFTPTTSHDC